MNDIKDKVIDKLRKLNTEIINEKDLNEDEYMIATTDAIITIDNKKKDITICFHVSSRIEDSVIMSLTLNEIRGIKLFISDVFIFDDDGNYIDGDKAIELFESKKAEKIVKDFIKFQTEKHILMQSDGYKC